MVFHHPETLTALCGSSVVCGSTPLSAWLPVHKIDISIKQQEMIRTKRHRPELFRSGAEKKYPPLLPPIHPKECP